MITTALRNATLSDLVDLLKQQDAAKLDVVVGANAIRSEDGVIVIKDTEPVLTEDGVTLSAGRYLPTAVFDEGVATKLGIPVQYLRKLRTERPDLYDANVNGLLHGRKAKVAYRPLDSGYDVVREAIAADPRQFMVRAFKGQDDLGVARALLSDRYARLDNFDVLASALDGVRQAGVEVEITRCDLTERKMYVVVEAPAIKALAPVLLAGYRSPFDRSGHGQAGLRDADGNLPIVHAGFLIKNSETGGGAATLTPRLVAKVCSNGMTIDLLAQRNVHLGRSLDEGVVKWTHETAQRSLDLMKSMTADAVRSFCSVDFVTEQIAKIEAQAGVEVVNAADTVKVIGKKLAYTETQVAGILDHFIKGGQLTAGGILNAVTSFAQEIEDADIAYELESTGLKALALASRAA
jgi:hypothetical protein